MKTTDSRNSKQEETWPQLVQVGNGKVSIYKRQTAAGNDNYLLYYKEDGKKRMPCFKERGDAFGKADEIARRLDGQVVAARHISHSDAVSYFASADRLKPYSVTIDAVTATVAQCLQIKGIGNLATIYEACKFYASRHRPTTTKTVKEVVDELTKVKETRGASDVYVKDLKYRLNQFSDAFACNIGSVQTADVQTWLDGKKVSTQSYMNFRRVVFLLFEFAVARGYCLDNPIGKVETVKIRNGDVQVFTPKEIGQLISAAPDDFRASILLGAFAGLRSAEIERLTWKDIDLTERCITVGADKAKTGSRRTVPISDNLAAWLAKCSRDDGKVWKQGSVCFYRRMQETAASAKLDWKTNALRHSYISYRLAVVQDAAKVAMEAGNSPNVVHRHYKALVKPTAATAWFNVMPETPANVVTMPKAASN